MPKQVVVLEDTILTGIILSALCLFSTYLNSHFTLPKLFAITVLTSTLLLVFLLRLHRRQFNSLPASINIPAIGLAVWWVLGTTQAIHLHTALQGQIGRHNGLYTHLLWLTLFLVMGSLQFDLVRAQRFLTIAYVATLAVCLYALAQYLGLGLVFEWEIVRPFASIGNPVSLAAIILLISPFVLSELVAANPRTKKRLLFLFLFLVLLLGVFVLARSRGPWAGMVVALVIVAFGNGIWDRTNIRIKRYTLLAGSILAGLMVYVFGLPYLSRLTVDPSVELRLVYWSAALAMIEDAPVFGFGFESFRLMYPAYRSLHDYGMAFDVGSDTFPTMVHNDYLQLATDNGLPALLLYLLLIGAAMRLMIHTVRTRPELKRILIPAIAGASGYLVQALSGWIEVATSAMFWMVLGLGVSVALTGKRQPGNATVTPIRFKVMLTVAALIVLLFYVSVLANSLSLDYTLRKAQAQGPARPSQRTADLLATLSNRTQDDYYYQDQIGVIHLKRFARRPTKGEYREAQRHFLRARGLNPFDPYVRIHLIETDIIGLKRKAIRNPSDATLAEADELLHLDPNNPTVYRTRIALFEAMGERERQAQEIKKVSIIEQRVLEAGRSLASRNALAELYVNQGRYDDAELLLRKTLEKSRRVLGEEHRHTQTAIDLLIRVFRSTGDVEKARPFVADKLTYYERIVSRPSASGDHKNDYAWYLLTCEPADLRGDPQEALRLALEANEMTAYKVSAYVDTLALAYFQTGQTAKAIETEKKAISLEPESMPELRRLYKDTLRRFEAATQEEGSEDIQ